MSKKVVTARTFREVAEVESRKAFGKVTAPFIVAYLMVCCEALYLDLTPELQNEWSIILNDKLRKSEKIETLQRVS